jgi:hypothetical protein
MLKPVTARCLKVMPHYIRLHPRLEVTLALRLTGD